jgi:hypothetical protein
MVAVSVTVTPFENADSSVIPEPAAADLDDIAR